MYHMTPRLYLLTLQNAEGEEVVEEIYAYSDEQADFFAREIAKGEAIISLECTARRATYR